MKNVLILLLLTFSLSYSKTNDFSLIIDEPFNNALLDVTQDYDRQISAVGFSRSFKSAKNSSKTYTNAFDYLSSISDSHGSQMHLIKVDDSAKLTISKAAKLSKFSEAIALVKTPANGYFVGGYTLDGSLIIVKLDDAGNVIFKKTFGTNNYDRMNNLVLLSDGGVLAVGTSVTTRSKNDNMFETGLGLNDIYLTRFSKEGRKLWSKKYGTGYDDKGIDAVEARDGSIIVVAKTDYDKNKNVTLMRITENGNKIWLKHYKSETTTTPYKVIRLRDDNFILLLSEQNDMHKEQIRLLKFDLQKNVITDKYVKTSYSSALKDIKEFSDSNLMAVGYVKDSYNTDALVMILDSELNMLNQEHYGDENHDVFNALYILHDSKVAVAGINTAKNSQESNMWLTKLNQDGTMAQVSSHTSDFYTQLRELYKEEIDKNVLVVKEDLTIEFRDKRLLFMVGEYQLTQEQKTFIDKFSTKLLAFLRERQDALSELEINGHTSSEWNGSGFTDTYLKNSKLSMNRSYATLSFIFKGQDVKTQAWLSKIIQGSGFSYSKKLMINDKEESQKSRRVSFKIILENKNDKADNPYYQKR